MSKRRRAETPQEEVERILRETPAGVMPPLPSFLVYANRAPLSPERQAAVELELQRVASVAGVQPREDWNMPRNWRTPEALALLREIEQGKAEKSQARKAEQAEKRATDPALQAVKAARQAAVDNFQKLRVFKQREGNPKKEGTDSFAYWEHYRDGMTVAAYLDCFEDRARGLRWLKYDVKQGNVRLEAP